MEAERKRKRPAEDWEDKRWNTRGDAGNSRGAAAGSEEAARPPVDGDVEEEVEEFFAIVRRMHAIRRQLSGGDDRMIEASGRQMLRRGQAEGKGIYRWRPAFEWEDFEERRNHKFPDAGDAGDCCTRGEVGSATSASLAAVGVGGRREEKTAPKGTAVCLDLNKEPEPELVVG